MGLPILVPLAAVGAAAYLLLRPKPLTEGQKATAAALPPKEIAVVPALSPLAQQLVDMNSNAGKVSEYAKPGEGAVVWLTFDPHDASPSNVVRALRFLELTALIPSDVKNDPNNADYGIELSNFQTMAGLPVTGFFDQGTQDSLWRQVIALNAKNHNLNVKNGKSDSDWIAVQNKAGAEDPRGAWSVSGASMVFGRTRGYGTAIGGRAGHRQADLIGKRSGHGQADLIGKRSGHGQADLIGKRSGHGQADLIGRTRGYGTAVGAMLQQDLVGQADLIGQGFTRRMIERAKKRAAGR